MVAEAVAEVAELTKTAVWSVGQWYDFACVYSVASGKIADKRTEYADRAMELLQKAVKLRGGRTPLTSRRTLTSTRSANARTSRS